MAIGTVTVSYTHRIVRDVGKLSQGMEKSADGTYNGYRFMSVCGVQNVQTFLEELRHGNCGKLFEMCIRDSLKYCDVKSIRYIDDRVEVIEDQCILCGHCINICPQQAKTVVNDPTVVLEMLSDPGVRVVASLAPSYICLLYTSF